MKRFCLIVFVARGLNFVAFLIGAAAIGGDAVNGESGEGHYYVADHGKLNAGFPIGVYLQPLHCCAVWATQGWAMCALLLCPDQPSKGSYENSKVS